MRLMGYQIWKEKNVSELEDVVAKTIQNECSGEKGGKMN